MNQIPQCLILRAVMVLWHKPIKSDWQKIYVWFTWRLLVPFTVVSLVWHRYVKGRSTKEPTSVHLNAMGYLVQNRTRARHRWVTSSSVSDWGKIQAYYCLKLRAAHEQVFITKQSKWVKTYMLIELKASIDRAWRITSYSGLVKQGSHGAEPWCHEWGVWLRYWFGWWTRWVGIDWTWTFYIHVPSQLPPWYFLAHLVWGMLGFTEPATSEHNTQVITHLLESEQYELEWLPVLQQLVDTVLNTALDGKNLKLSERLNATLSWDGILTTDRSACRIGIESNHSISWPLSAKAGDLGFPNRARHVERLHRFGVRAPR